MAATFEIHDNHFKLEGINFFRANASSVTLGAAGEKKTPATQQNYLAVEERVPPGKLVIRKALTIDIASARLSEKDIGGSIVVPGLGTLSAAAAADKLRTESIRLVKLEVLPRKLVDAANESPRVLDALKRIGRGGRLVHQVVVAMDAKLASIFANAASIDAAVTVKGIGLTAHAGSGSSGGTTVDFSDATFAYLLLDLKWDANQIKNWRRIEGWEDDQWSLY